MLGNVRWWRGLNEKRGYRVDPENPSAATITGVVVVYVMGTSAERLRA